MTINETINRINEVVSRDFETLERMYDVRALNFKEGFVDTILNSININDVKKFDICTNFYSNDDFTKGFKITIYVFKNNVSFSIVYDRHFPKC